MILKVTCPSCQKAYRLSPPYPPPGKRYRCTCSAVITVSYPTELRQMIDRGEAPTATTVDAIPGPLQSGAPTGGAAGAPTSVTQEVDRLLWTQTGESSADLVRTQDGASSPAPADDVAETVLIKTQRAPELAATQPTEDMASTQQAPRPAGPRGTQELARTQPASPPEELLRTQKVAVALDPRRTEELAPDEDTNAGIVPPDLQRRGPPPPEGRRASPPEERGAPIAPQPAAERPDAEDPDAPAAPAANSPPRPRAPRGPRFWLKVGAAAILLVGALGVAAVGGVVWYFSQDLPSVQSLADYRPPVVSRAYSADGEIIGEFFEEYRDVTPIEEMPRHVVNAFLAAEDSGFYEHGGIDYLGIARAFFVNLQEGRMAQGASTITQQVARSFLLSREKKLERKIREVLLAYKVEANFAKEHILYLYLNQIFLGEGAYGVAAGARIYFDKDIRDVSLAEAAILAGLPQAPSAYNPVRNWASARDRQKYVLGQMVRNGMISEQERDGALAEEITLVGRVNRNRGPAASFTEHVRRMLVDTYGHEAVYKGGLTIETTLTYSLQETAARAVAAGAEQTDRRIGYRGPLEKIGEDAIPGFLSRRWEELRLEKWSEIPGGPDKAGPPPPSPPALAAGDKVKGVLTEVTKTWARVGIDKDRAGYLTLDQHTWLYEPNPKRNWKRRAQDDLTAILAVGDVLEFVVDDAASEARRKRLSESLTTKAGFDRWLPLKIHQSPAIEAALFSYRVTDGAVLAMVGGYDFNESEFNRVVQAKRQAGSTFKPFVYASALDHPEKHYSPSTILLDAPLTMHKETSDDESIDLWKPSNYGGDYMGEITLRRALILSRNTPTVRILDDIGVPYFYDYVKRLGFESPLNKDLSMGLGSSSVSLLEMVRAYSIFASLGERIEPRFIDRVIDRDGNVLADNRGDVVRVESMNPETAFVVTEMLKDVVTMGTGTGARKLGKPVAGKTGTTNDFKDAWFMGFTPQVVTGVWTGYDQPENMGYSQTGGDAALPIWVDYMEEALKVYPDTSYKTPSKVVFVTVDPDSGLLATDSTERRMRIAFIEGTEPREYARAQGEVGTDDFFMMDAPF